MSSRNPFLVELFIAESPLSSASHFVANWNRAQCDVKPVRVVRCFHKTRAGLGPHSRVELTMTWARARPPTETSQVESSECNYFRKRLRTSFPRHVPITTTECQTSGSLSQTTKKRFVERSVTTLDRIPKPERIPYLITSQLLDDRVMPCCQSCQL